MKLSIIVPVYNMAADGKLAYCIDSLINQTLRKKQIPYEIIAVDDASTDDSLRILRQYETGYPGILKVIHYKVNKRQGGAKNEGLKAACGEWIGFLDSDDWAAPDMFEKLLAKAEETGADLVGCDYSLVESHTMQAGRIVQNNTSDQTGILDEEKHKRLLLKSGSMVIKIYRHSVITENDLKFPEGIFYEDNCAGPLWSLYFRHFEKVEEPLYYYYQHEASTVHFITEDRCRDRIRAGELFYEECKKRGFLQQYREEIEYRFTELYFVNTLFSYLQGMKHPKLSFVKKLRAGELTYFPAFQDNRYYRERVGKEEQYWITLLQKNAPVFFLYYRMKFLVRKMKKR